MSEFNLLKYKTERYYKRKEAGVIRQLIKMKKRGARWIHLSKSPLETPTEVIGKGTFKKSRP
jgi:hypothetical protein